MIVQFDHSDMLVHIWFFSQKLRRYGVHELGIPITTGVI